jgi:AbrB family looped-hinge helix DNA binding protein
MLQSVITRKGQTTIPKEIREFLRLKPNDKLFYIVEDSKVILKPIHGDILQLRGSVPSRERLADFEKIRETTRKQIAREIAEGN